MNIQKATVNELDSIVELFDMYRVFYEQKSDIKAAKLFLNERLRNEESIIFIAKDAENTVGFVQLYPVFSSVSMRRTWLLNDLYVRETNRGKGVGEKLIKTAIDFAKETGAKGVSLETGQENSSAQRLYEKIGFVRESNYFYYFSI
ncbi:GNAT family N-acetyltransferase [Neobacillus sp. FSL H8-0543]|uniref:GNAT family N-acetyltransferase n=1 Tax=Neobacillus sp. FSL H8-0543 TaxID=2954672 RepID=UPI003158DA2F